MAQIKTEQQYRKLMQRVDELLEVVDDNTPKDDVNYIELDLISNLVEEYEDVHYPIGKPSLVDIIKLRLYEMNLTQTKLEQEAPVSCSWGTSWLNSPVSPDTPVNMSRRTNLSYW